MPKLKPKKLKCSRCEKALKKDQAYDWLEDDDVLSPTYCYNCYVQILDKFMDCDEPKALIDLDDDEVL